MHLRSCIPCRAGWSSLCRQTFGLPCQGAPPHCNTLCLLYCHGSKRESPAVVGLPIACAALLQCWYCCAATSAIHCTAPCAGLRRGWCSRQPPVIGRDCWLFVNSLQQLWAQGGQAVQSHMVPRKQLLQGRMTAQRQLCRCSYQVPACSFLRLPPQTQVSQSHVTRQLRLHIVAAAVQRAQNQSWSPVLILKTLQHKH
jgi:hypothetical protein